MKLIDLLCYMCIQLFDRYSVTTLTTLAHLLFVFRNMVFMVLKHDDLVSIITALGLQVINGKKKGGRRAELNLQQSFPF